MMNVKSEIKSHCLSKYQLYPLLFRFSLGVFWLATNDRIQTLHEKEGKELVKLQMTNSFH